MGNMGNHGKTQETGETGTLQKTREAARTEQSVKTY